MTTQRSNPFNDIDGLVEALKKAPQDKEGAFRVATWLMVLQEMQRLAQQLDDAEAVASEIQNAVQSQPTATPEEIAAKVKAELQSDLAQEDADKYLF